MGAAYGTAKSGTGIAAMAVMRPEAIMKSIIPVIMAGIIAIYGVVVAVLIAGQLEPAPAYTLYRYTLHRVHYFIHILNRVNPLSVSALLNLSPFSAPVSTLYVKIYSNSQ